MEASSSSALQPTATAASSSSALQPTASAAASSGASQPNVVTEMWTRIQEFGRFPKRVDAPDSEAQYDENALFAFLYNEKKKGVPDVVWKEMRNYGASQPVDATQQLLHDVRSFHNKSGRMPKRKKKRSQTMR